MKKRFPIYFMLCLFIASFSVSCGDDDSVDDSMYEYVVSGNTAITKFSLNADDSVLSNLDSVFFSIDLANRLIYNADSLPKGTDISGLSIKMNYATSATAQIDQKGGTVRRDTVFDYSEQTVDTIDFTGNVTIKIKAADGTEAFYQVKVNVHKMEPDSMYWGKMAHNSLPGAVGNVVAQKTVAYQDNYYTLVANENGSLALSKCENIAAANWEKVEANFGFVPDVKTLEATTDALYILDENGALHTSVDGASWTSCGTVWHSMLGGYLGKVLGVVEENGAYKYDEYPRTAGYVSSEVESTFPVEGASQMVTYDNGWSVTPQAMVVGGIDKTGRFHGDVWGYDGNMWCKLQSNTLPPLADMTVFVYKTYSSEGVSVGSAEYLTWYAVGGRNSKGVAKRDMYISRHHGLYWKQADEMLQMPEYIDAFSDAQAYVETSVLTRSNSAWTSMPSRKLPVWAMPMPLTRASQAITSWECPYIYVFGGNTNSGYVGNNIWRGVINRLTFKPIY